MMAGDAVPHYNALRRVMTSLALAHQAAGDEIAAHAEKHEAELNRLREKRDTALKLASPLVRDGKSLPAVSG